MIDLKNPTSPATLAAIALVVGAIVRVLKGKRISDLLDALPVSWINRIPRKVLPWLAVVLGMVIALLNAKLNEGASWKDAIYAGLAGVLAGSTAVAGHETVAKLIGFFLYKPNGPLDPPGPTTPAKPSADDTQPVASSSPDAMLKRSIFNRGGTRLLATLLTISLGVTVLPGCAAFAALLPGVIAAVLDGMQVIDAIEAFVARYFAAHPDPATQAKIDTAILKARAALNVALRSAQGAKNLDDAQIDKAFDDFKQAYLELMSLVKPYGVTQVSTGKLSATPTKDGKLEVPEPMAFKRGAK